MGNKVTDAGVPYFTDGKIAAQQTNDYKRTVRRIDAATENPDAGKALTKMKSGMKTHDNLVTPGSWSTKSCLK